MKMAENMTEDEVRDKAREILGLNSVGGGGNRWRRPADAIHPAGI